MQTNARLFKYDTNYGRFSGDVGVKENNFIVNGRIIEKTKPVIVRQAVSPETAAAVNRIMQTVITEGGTGTNAALEGYTVCGKTGTARKLDENGVYSNSRHMASFVGFTPAENPKLTILVVIDEPQGKYYGGTVAAPVFRRIAREALNYLNIPPQNGIKRFATSSRSEARG